MSKVVIILIEEPLQVFQSKLVYNLETIRNNKTILEAYYWVIFASANHRQGNNLAMDLFAVVRRLQDYPVLKKAKAGINKMMVRHD